MLKIRKASERGPSDLGWLRSYHTFSFGHYYDPEHMGFESLRVINDDRVVPGAGFGTHPHDNMEIVSYVLDGELEHKDSMGNGSVIKPGDVQRMSAGTGVTHSEFNSSSENGVHFLQIWFLPNERNIKPDYEQKYYSADSKVNNLKLIVSPDGRDGSVSINQDVNLYASILTDKDHKVDYKVQSDRSVWIHVAQGRVNLNGHELSQGDGVAITEELELVFKEGTSCEFLLFDLKSSSQG